ncbi:hypothetical protein GQ53DRAFT_31360 [Thozetella sp. PMI_491]|nr:hypothetical protein GQ53DRAFT_31360 [Thozetella sp. PMI_491]
MGETEPVAASAQPAKDEQALQQPKDAVPMEKMDKKEEEAGQKPEGESTLPVSSEAGAALATTSAPKAETSAAASAEPSSEDALKGKAKEQALADASKDAEDDSLEIQPSAPAGADANAPPVCNITLLLPTGARHPYRIDEKYLSKRQVDIPEANEAGHPDPFSISVYKLKELILREWRDEWDNKPASPSSIRLIHFGKLLEDKEQLKRYQFSADSPNVVHMSVKPAEMLEEDEAGKTSGREGRSREGGGGCCVIL